MHAIYHHKRGFWQCGAGWRFGRRHGFYAEVKEQAAIDVRNEALRRGEG